MTSDLNKIYIYKGEKTINIELSLTPKELAILRNELLKMLEEFIILIESKNVEKSTKRFYIRYALVMHKTLRQLGGHESNILSNQNAFISFLSAKSGINASYIASELKDKKEK